MGVCTVTVDPFKLFPALVRHVDLVQPKAPGIAPEFIATLSVIVKSQTASDDFTDIASRNLQRRLHIKTDTLPKQFVSDVDALLGKNILMDGRAYRINNVTRGDDFENGLLPFLTVQVIPAGRRSL